MVLDLKKTEPMPEKKRQPLSVPSDMEAPRQLALDEQIVQRRGGFALYCSNCAKREWGLPQTDEQVQKFESRVYKLRDYLSVPQIESRPCLGVCPDRGITVTQKSGKTPRSKSKTWVITPIELQKVDELFDPLRQLSLFS